ncbi:MAG: hypothetical protein M1828_005510 [Chrysothrix sp. TS-e1954]|nr:MAG: hypothetical protein M1828_005510 [Chrysothrix sp. TS-e1954]
MHGASSLPFGHSAGLQTSDDQLDDLLPATYRGGFFNDRVMVASPSLACLEADLLVEKLNALHSSLWYVGRPMPPRPLHHQEVIRRRIVITEQMALHLVWTRQHRIFLKPVPRYLLSLEFWTRHILCPSQASTDALGCGSTSLEDCERRQKLVGCALGFLFSYTALIAHESDFRIACDRGLLPEGVSWSAWKTLSRDLLRRHDYGSVNRRFRYGELRLSRLDEVCRYKHGQLGGYASTDKYRLYIDFFQDNLGKIASVLGYVVVVLEALQVGIAARYDRTFVDFAWGFAIFAIIAPVSLLLIVVLAFLIAYWANWRATKHYHRKRLQYIQSAMLDGSEKSDGVSVHIDSI